MVTEIRILSYSSHLFLYAVQLAVRRIAAVCSNKLIWIVFKETVHAWDLSRNSSVGVATTEESSFDYRQRRGIYLFCTVRLLIWPSILCNGYRGSLFPVVKRPGRETDRSPVSNAEIKNKWSLCHQSSMCLHGVQRMGCPSPFPTS